MEEITKIMTGSYDLNKWLDGGYDKDVISLFYGPAASGKSNFVMLAACHNAKKDKKSFGKNELFTLLSREKITTTRAKISI